MTKNERLEYEAMPIYELANEAHVLKRLYKDHYELKRMYKDGLDHKKFAFHSKEYRRCKVKYNEVVNLIKKRQMSLC